jgi:hypothetical protein
MHWVALFQASKINFNVNLIASLCKKCLSSKYGTNAAINSVLRVDFRTRFSESFQVHFGYTAGQSNTTIKCFFFTSSRLHLQVSRRSSILAQIFTVIFRRAINLSACKLKITDDLFLRIFRNSILGATNHID